MVPTIYNRIIKLLDDKIALLIKECMNVYKICKNTGMPWASAKINHNDCNANPFPLVDKKGAEVVCK